jgi:NAD+ synthase
MAEINTHYIYEEVISWLHTRKDSGCRGVVLGLSGGKDSTVVAMLAKQVWGDNVYALIMPNGSQKDINDAIAIAEKLQLKYNICDIENMYHGYWECAKNKFGYSVKAFSNVTPRIRMTLLYAAAQSLGYQVIGTGNASERYIGWCTKFGDMGCDFNPIGHLVCREVVALGELLAYMYDLPREYIVKTPADGLTGRSDEENFGFRYEELDDYITCGTSGDPRIDEEIERLHKAAMHKLVMPAMVRE